MCLAMNYEGTRKKNTQIESIAFKEGKNQPKPMYTYAISENAM